MDNIEINVKMLWILPLWPWNYVPGGKEPVIFVSDWAESIGLIFICYSSVFWTI